MLCTPTSPELRPPLLRLIITSTIRAFSTISSIRRMDHVVHNPASQHQFSPRRIGSNPDRITASGVSSMIKGLHLCHGLKGTVLRPSRPILFVPSFHSVTSYNENCGLRDRCLHISVYNVNTYSFAFCLLLLYLRTPISLIITTDSCFTSSSTIFNSSLLLVRVNHKFVQFCTRCAHSV